MVVTECPSRELIVSKKKMTPAQKAAARRPRSQEEIEARERALAEREAAKRARNLDTPRERQTRRMLTVIQVVLVAYPLVGMALASLSGTSIEELLATDPTFAVTLLSVFVQPLVAWLLRFVYRHYGEGDGGYAAGNLICLLCAELMLQNVLGIAGVVVLLWRIWGSIHGELIEWARRRGVGGVLFDISGALVVLAIALLVAFSSWRISMA